MMRMAALSIAASLCLPSGFAAPPVNLAGDADKGLPRERPLTQDDLIYTDNVKPDDAVLHEAGRILFDVPGRSLPNRKGKIIHKFVENDLVRILKDSKDGRWMAVETFSVVKNKGRKQAWVPKNSVKPPLPPEPVAPHPAPTEMNMGGSIEDDGDMGPGDPAGLNPSAPKPPGAESPLQGF